MKKTGWFRKLTSISLSLLLMMTAFPVYAEEVAVEPAPQAEYNEVADIVEEPVESDVPAVEAIVENEASDAPAEIEEAEYVEEEADAAAEESAVQGVQPAAAPNDAASQELLIIQQFFGVGEIAPEEEDFYRALFSYARMRGPGGMPMTIALSGGETVVFDGAKHQTTYTQGTITSQIQIPASYVVTFEAKAEGRLPGTYAPTLTSVSVMNGSMNMTGFFDISLTGGGIDITSAGSLLMVKADDVEFVFDGYAHRVFVTTGQAFINWMPMSDELQLTLQAVSVREAMPGTSQIHIDSYAITAIEDGTDVTQYFEYVFASDGVLTITPPPEKIKATVTIDTISLPQSVGPLSLTQFGDVVPLNPSEGPGDPFWLWYYVRLGPREDLNIKGTHILTQEDWTTAEVWGVPEVGQYFDITILPTTLYIN